MKLGILMYSRNGGGAERVVSYILPYFQEKKVDVSLILMNSKIGYNIPEGIPIYYIEDSQMDESGINKLIKIPRLAYKYAKLAKKLELTHSFSLLTRPNYINIISKYYGLSTPKTIISERAHPTHQYGYNDLKSKINKFLINKLYPKASQVICNSHGNANDLELNFGVDKKRIRVIHNPIDLETISIIEPDHNFFNPEYFNILTVGRLEIGKNHKLLINSVQNIHNARLYILGDGELMDELKEIIERKNLHNKVFLMGFNRNPFRYLKAADLFIFGSNHEGFPNVLLEAMACGLPILTTNCESGPDEIMELKTAKSDNIMITPLGILVPINDEVLMAKGLQYCIENPEYLARCKEKMKSRILDFEKNKILEDYKNHILQ